MKLIVFGASGGVGRQVVRQALEAGHQVTAYVRDPNLLSINHSSLKVIQGDALHLGYVKEAIKGQDAVISCIGSRGMGKTTLMSDVMLNVLDGMREHGVTNIAYVASAGIHRELKGVIGYIISYVLRHVLADHRRAYERMRDSELRWTVARPLQLTDGGFTGIYREAESSVPTSGQKISRADVAHFLLKAVVDDKYNGKSVGLAY
ncbi:MAG: NAD(P)-dependent oxidoreductase [Candidatus Pristimantibacillus sp.]